MPYNFVWGGLSGRWKMPITIFQQRFQQPLFTMRRKWTLSYLQGNYEQLEPTKSTWFRGTVVDHWQSWTLVKSTLWSVWSVRGSLRTTATRWDMLFLFSTVLSLLSQHLAYIQTLPTTSPGSKSRSEEFFCIIIICRNLFYRYSHNRWAGEGKWWIGILLWSLGISSVTW